MNVFNVSCVIKYNKMRSNLENLCITFGTTVVFGRKKDEVTGECRRLHKEELHHLHSSPNVTRVVKKGE